MGKPRRPKPSESASSKPPDQVPKAKRLPPPREKSGEKMVRANQRKLEPPSAEQPDLFAHLKNPKQRAFLKAFCVTGQVLRAATVAKIAECTHYWWTQKDSAYKEAFKECRRIVANALESEAFRRAFEGCRRFKFDRKGNPLINPETKKPYVEFEYSDTLMVLLLKANKPEKYRERRETKHRVSMDEPGQGDGFLEFLREKAISNNGHGNS